MNPIEQVVGGVGLGMVGLLFTGEISERLKEVSSWLARPQIHRIKHPKQNGDTLPVTR